MERDRQLRERLVETLERNGILTDPAVRSAVLAVPRHEFIPGVSLDDAYEDRAVAVKERDGVVISSISQPAMVVEMLQLLEVRAGNAVLEVGTGTGYNAALLATMAGTNGRVVTVDIESDLLDSASARLAAAGFSRVRALDAAELTSFEGTFDRVIVTARAEDIDAQWWRLLADGGRLVVPLDLAYGGERALGFRRDGDALRSYGSHACAFITMRQMPPTDATQVFFPNRNFRYAAPPRATVPMAVVAMQRGAATEALMDDADVVVARPQTIFALRLS